MPDILREIEEINYIDRQFKESSYWKNKLLDFFKDFYIDDLTDLNYSTCYTYLISLSEKSYSLFSKEVDTILELRDLYFLEIIISTEKPLISFHFWKYLKKEAGIDRGFLVSSFPYLKEDGLVFRKMIDFIDHNKLKFLDNKDLATRFIDGGRQVSLYYKFFNQEGEDPFHIPY